MKNPNILFIHSVYPSQFSLLHNHLNKNNLAKSYYLCGQNFHEAHQFSTDNLYAFNWDGNPMENKYFFSGEVERSSKFAIGVIGKVKEMLKRFDIDLIVAHGTLGSPNFLFGEIDIPIITYIEFPSYKHHGWDPKYPPTEFQRYADTNCEMLSYYQCVASDLVIVPSNYAKNMFPKILHDKIVVQMEGFDPQKLDCKVDKKFFEKEKGITYIGYTARGLSSAKGFEQFVKISKAILKRNKNVKFVVIGDPKGEGYGYEKQFLKERYNDDNKTFKDHVVETEAIDPKQYIFIDNLDYEDFAACINQIDFFLYPLQFGSANWGLFELLLRGELVIASDKCFMPEVIKNNENGILCDYNDIESWADKAAEIIKNPDEYKNIQENAKQKGAEFYIENIAPKYLKIFKGVVDQSRAKAKALHDN